VRVIAGRFGGRRLSAPKGREVRPTADRVREALFASLDAGGALVGARVLDLFAGTGALGIEALSRGAERAVFVEQDRGAATALQANLDTLGLAAEEAQVRRAEVAKALRDAREGAETYDLVFCDPPYRHAAGLGPTLSDALRPVLAPAARVVTESDRRAPLALDLPLTDERRYGDTLIRFHTP
jgi:16S rRNA (guanine(966)-N(2))-methyltransferase RsmD